MQHLEQLSPNLPLVTAMFKFTASRVYTRLALYSAIVTAILLIALLRDTKSIVLVQVANQQYSE